MSENLKVNSKTSELEFKRKHNKLVDKVNEGGSGGTQLYKHLIIFQYESEEITEEVDLEVISLFSTEITNDNLSLLGASSLEFGTYFNQSIIKAMGNSVLSGAFNICFDSYGDYCNIGIQSLSSSGISSLTWLSFDFVVLSDTITEL